MPKAKASEAFITAYIECALWATTDNTDDSGGEPLDANYDADDLTKACRKQMVDDCHDFVGLCEREGQPFNESDEYAGHDFFLTRCGHGAGFWDRGLPNGEELSKLAKTFGDVYLYVHRKRIHHG